MSYRIFDHMHERNHLHEILVDHFTILYQLLALLRVSKYLSKAGVKMPYHWRLKLPQFFLQRSLTMTLYSLHYNIHVEFFAFLGHVFHSQHSKTILSPFSHRVAPIHADLLCYV